MFLPSRLTTRLAVVVAASLVATMAGPAAPAPAEAAGVTMVASSSNGSSSSRTSIKVKRPEGTAAGQVMVAAIASNDDEPGFSAPPGWMVVREDTVPGKLRQAVYVKVAEASEPSSYSWTVDEWRRLAGGITTYTGVDPTQPVDSHGASINAAKGTAVPAPAITTSVAGTVLIHVAAINAEGSLKPPPDMTTRWKAASPNRRKSADALVSLADAPLAAAGDTGPRTATATKAGPNIGVLLALRPATGTQPAPPPDPPPPPVTDPPPPPVTEPPPGDPVLVGAGDIADCANPTGAKATAALLDQIPGSVFTLGDNVYVDGTPQEFRDCYEPDWGRHKARTAFAVAGNHDYNTDGAAGHYGYFGAAAGNPSKGYYDATLGSWHVIVLNSNCEEIGGCGAGSPQEQWLRSVLAASPAECTVALWHHPGFSSATVHRAFPTYQPFWQALYDSGADVVMVASDHVYERFGFQNPTGDADTVFGLRQFTVGTGGRSHQSFKTVLPNSEVRNGGTYGVLKLTLHPGSYDWQFVPEAGKTFTDQGTSACHGAPPAPAAEPGPITPMGSSNNSATASRSLTLARPSATTAGQVMVASVVSSDDHTVAAAPEGWTPVRSDFIPDILRQTIYVKVAGDAEPPSYTWTVAERQQLAGGITTYAGVDPVGPVEAHAATVAQPPGTTVSAPSVTTLAADTRLVHFAAVNAEGTLVSPSGMTQRWLATAPVGATTDVLTASYDARQPEAGPTGLRMVTATEPGSRIAAVLVLRPAP